VRNTESNRSSAADRLSLKFMEHCPSFFVAEMFCKGKSIF
jgi:hypothetical protein